MKRYNLDLVAHFPCIDIDGIPEELCPTLVMLAKSRILDIHLGEVCMGFFGVAWPGVE